MANPEFFQPIFPPEAIDESVSTPPPGQGDIVVLYVHLEVEPDSHYEQLANFFRFLLDDFGGVFKIVLFLFYNYIVNYLNSSENTPEPDSTLFTNSSVLFQCPAINLIPGYSHFMPNHYP